MHILATGGTLAKRYEPCAGELVVDNTVLDALVAGLTLPDMALTLRHVLACDSLDMTDAQRLQVVAAVRASAPAADGVVIAHGTDTLTTTSALLQAQLPDPKIPVVLTGAMVPHSCGDSDARQNMTQAIMACRLLPPGVHIVFHGQVHDAVRTVKSHARGTFESLPDEPDA